MYWQFQNDLSIGNKFEVIAHDRIIKYYENKFKVIETCNGFRYDFKLSNN